MIIKVDHREADLCKKIEYYILNQESFKTIKIMVENLPLGDIILFDEETQKEMVIIERKSLNDLSASIKDGRYEEQSYRLDGINHANHNIVYLIEGDLNHKNSVLFKDRFDKNTLYSAMVSILFYKGFSVLRSYDMSETAYMMCNMAYKLGKTKKPFYYSLENQDSKSTIIPQIDTYPSVVKRVKKENVTKENIAEIMLCQIPGISSQTAQAILGKYKTIAILIDALKTDQTCLNDVCTFDSKNKSRKISKKCIEKLFDFFHAA